ncbi:MAG: thioredoxin domain-containing protein [Gemmatimonadota bacterium]|nr:MAG: thioredoxin domain-containing protein [Gemmatimonadota bacterium]
MQESSALSSRMSLRMANFVFGSGMVIASALTIKHFFDANYPDSIWAGSFCDISAFFNCENPAFSSLAAIGGVPIGYFGVFVGALVSLGALFPSASFERSNKTIALFNIWGVVALLVYSLAMGSLCLLCAGYYIFAALSFYLFWRHGIDRSAGGFMSRWLRPSPKHLATYGVVMLVGAYGVALYHDARRDAQSGGAVARVVEEYFGLPQVKAPSIISPYMAKQSTERFEDAPIRIIEYGDLLCSDCVFLHEQLQRLEPEFEGKINVAFQFFPLDARCNQVVEKDKHPGACDLSYMTAYDIGKFRQLHDEIFANFELAKDPAWRSDFAKRHGLEAALSDSATIKQVQRIINTGAEYEKTSEEYAHGIRSTPTMILNGRMVIGTFPDAQLRAIFRALLAEQEEGRGRRFLENWVEG